MSDYKTIRISKKLHEKLTFLASDLHMSPSGVVDKALTYMWHYPDEVILLGTDNDDIDVYEDFDDEVEYD